MVDYEALPLQNSQTSDCKPPRVASLDVFRGLSVFLMMLVDYGGAIFPTIVHSPWNGVHLADFVMPFFLFVAGVALAIVYKRVPNRVDASWKAVTRALQLFVFGVFLQGGYLHGAQSLTYGVDMERIRWMGILQRISIAYAITAICEIWLPCKKSKRSGPSGFFSSYVLQWSLVIFLASLYFLLSYGLYVPDWEFKSSDLASSLNSSNSTHLYKVKCGVRGDHGPACSSAAMIDRYVLGINHLYAKPAFTNLKECNKSSDGKVSDSSPSWCHAPFDPEGLLGCRDMHFGAPIWSCSCPTEHKERLWKWSIFSVSLFVLGLLFAFIGVPLNKSLYTVSYALFTSGSAGITFCALYILVDVYGYRKVTYILEWMGIHSLSIFVLIASNIAFILIQGFYFNNPSNNIIHWIISCFVHQ